MKRSLVSLDAKPLSPWKLMLRDGLNLYGAIAVVNLINVLFWFIMKPTGIEDPIKTIVTSMAAVLTTSMSLRIVLSVRGSLAHGGSFALSGTSGTSSSSRTTHVISTRSGAPTNISSHTPHTYTLDEMRSKTDGEWAVGDPDAKSSVTESKGQILESDKANQGVKVVVDRQVG
jgi:hypothetical protein